MSEIENEKKEKFPSVFWTANITELFERGAYYAMASFVVLYLGQLGLGKYWPSTLNGSVLWTLVYFLPILSGTIADHVGFKRSLLVAFVLLAAGYLLMGYPVWFGGHVLNPTVGDAFTAGTDIVLPVVLAILFIGVGGSVIKPCISGTVKKTAGMRATFAFAIFYMVINIGSLVGRGVAYITRTKFNLSFIFAVSVCFSIIAFFVVLFFYRDVEKDPNNIKTAEAEKQPQKTVGQIFLDMFRVLKNPRFTLFLLVMSGFWFIYNQVYNVIPLYLKKVVELNPAMDVITMANPLVIVLFQLMITRRFGKMKPTKSIIVGGIIISLSMIINIVPIYIFGNVQEGTFVKLLPMGSLFAVFTVALIAFGELFAAARQFEYIGALAPKGKEGLFLGYANLPMAIGSFFGGFGGAFIFNDIMLKNAVKQKDGLLNLDPNWNALGWIILMTIGLLSAFFMWLYNRWLQKHPA